MMKQLTKQQKDFVSEYIRTLDCEYSAATVGYKTKNLKQFAQKLLRKDYIISEIKKQLEQTIKSLNVQKAYVIQKLLKIAEFSLEEEDILDKDGNFTGKKKLRDSTAGLKALEALCKHLGFLSANDEKPTNEPRIITIENLNDNKI